MEGKFLWYQFQSEVWLDTGHIYARALEGDGYDPFTLQNLPNSLAKVENSKSAIDFVKKYGFLGYRMLSKEDLSLGEPLDWILAQARSVRFGLYLIVCLQDHQKLSELLKTAEVKVRFDQTELVERYNASMETIKYEFAEGPDLVIRNYPVSALEKNQQLFAKVILTSLVNENTKTVRRHLYLDQDGEISQQLKAGALIEVVWHHVGDAVLLGGKGIRTCQECGLPFIVTDKRQMFCPGDDFSSGSPCGTRYRVRKSRMKGDAQDGQGKKR